MQNDWETGHRKIFAEEPSAENLPMEVCLWKLICGTLVYGKLIYGKLICGKLVCEKLLERYFIVINTEEKRPVECSLGRTEPYSLLEEGSLERGIYVKIAPWE